MTLFTFLQRLGKSPHQEILPSQKNVEHQLRMQKSIAEMKILVLNQSLTCKPEQSTFIIYFPWLCRDSKEEIILARHWACIQGGQISQHYSSSSFSKPPAKLHRRRYKFWIGWQKSNSEYFKVVWCRYHLARQTSSGHLRPVTSSELALVGRATRLGVSNCTPPSVKSQHKEVRSRFMLLSDLHYALQESRLAQRCLCDQWWSFPKSLQMFWSWEAHRNKC